MLYQTYQFDSLPRIFSDNKIRRAKFFNIRHTTVARPSIHQRVHVRRAALATEGSPDEGQLYPVIGLGLKSIYAAQILRPATTVEEHVLR